MTRSFGQPRPAPTQDDPLASITPPTMPMFIKPVLDIEAMQEVCDQIAAMVADAVGAGIRAALTDDTEPTPAT